MLNKNEISFLIDSKNNRLDTSIIKNNKKMSNIHLFNKSSDCILINNNKINDIKNSLNDTIKNKNFTYLKPKIKNYSKKDNQIKANKCCKHNNYEKNKNYILYRKKKLENNIFKNVDEEGSINKTNIFEIKPNFDIFENFEIKNIFKNTNYYFFRNKKKLNEKEYEIKNKSQRNNTKNNYSDLNEHKMNNQIKYQINNSKNMNKIHHKYFES